MPYSNWSTKTADLIGVGDIFDTGKHFWYASSVYRCFGGVYVTLDDARGTTRQELFGLRQRVRTRTYSGPVSA